MSRRCGLDALLIVGGVSINALLHALGVRSDCRNVALVSTLDHSRPGFGRLFEHATVPLLPPTPKEVLLISYRFKLSFSTWRARTASSRYIREDVAVPLLTIFVCI